MKMRTFTVAALTAVLTAGFGASASATTDPAPQDRPVAGTAESAAILAELEGEQSAAEINALAESGVPVEFLWDPETNEFVAAVATRAPLFSSRAITISGPGCSADTVCLKNTAGTPMGYNGTGTKVGPWSNIKFMQAGNRQTRFYYAGGNMLLAAFTSATPKTAVKVDSFVR